jgi:transposase
MSELEQRLSEENARLRRELAQAKATYAAHTAQLERENAQLIERLNVVLAQRYGRSSERLSADQLALFNEAEAEPEPDEPGGDEAAPGAEPEAAALGPSPRRRGKRALAPELERIEVRHELPESERCCPQDGTALEVIGEQTSEQLDIVPAQVRVLRHIQVKYACPCCHEHVVTAPKPRAPIPGSQASPGLLAHVAVSKYLDHWPLYRQGVVFERMGAVVHRSTMSQWMRKAGELVQPLVNLLDDTLREQSYLHMDETTVQVLKEPGKAPESVSYMWVRVAGERERPVVLFDYDPSRSRTVAQRLLDGFHGILHSDGYAGYDAAIGKYGLLSAGCWAHARRRFDEVFKAAGLNPKAPLPRGKPPPAAVRKAAKALQLMKTLFAIEHRIRERLPEERVPVRQAESRPVVEALRAWLDATRPTVTPKSKLGQALAYLDGQWSRLVVFLDHGEVEMTNNAAEQAIRPFAVGRKNWLFSDTQGGAKASANLYSLLMTAKANGLEPYGYLRHLFERLPEATDIGDFEQLLPWNVDRTQILYSALGDVA